MNIEILFNAIKENVAKRKEQGFPMSYKKRQMYEMGFEDAIKWIEEGSNVVEQSEQLKCVDAKHYTGITKGKIYKVFKNPNGFNYPNRRFIHITNDLGFVKAYYKSCFEAY